MSQPADPEQLEAILERLRRAPNDPPAWEGLFRLTWPFVLALCHRSLPAPRRVLESEDLAQEVFFKFARYWHEKRPPLQDRDSLFSLLAVMTRRLAADAGRWQSRARRDTGRERSGAAQEIRDRRHGLAEVDLRDLLDRVCKTLDPLERQVLSLRLQDYELADIAQRLRVSTRTIERKLQRVREVLGPHLEIGENTRP